MGNCCSTDATATVQRGGAKPLEPVAAPPAPVEAAASPVAAPQPPSAGADGGASTPAPSGASERVQTPTRPPASAFGGSSAGAGASPVDAPGATHAVRIGGYNLRYSYYSKRGYYPECAWAAAAAAADAAALLTRRPWT